MAGQGGAAAAIHNAVRNARIHLSQAAIVAILSALKASAEVAKMFDPTGAAARSSSPGTALNVPMGLRAAPGVGEVVKQTFASPGGSSEVLTNASDSVAPLGSNTSNQPRPLPSSAGGGPATLVPQPPKAS